MAANGRRVSLALFAAAVGVALSMPLAAPAFARPGDSPENATDLGPYLGSSLTTSLASGGGIAPTGSYFFKILLDAGQTFRADFTPAPATLKLEALWFERPTIGSNPVAGGIERLTFTPGAYGMYTVYVGASSFGTFTVEPSISPISRIYGSDRIATAIAVSRRSFPGTAAAAVVAYGYNFPDALAAAPLAKAYGGPVLLTQTVSLRDDVTKELERLHPQIVYIVGSPSVVSTGIEARLRSLSSTPTVSRLGGRTRYETAALISDELRKKTGDPTHVVVVNGAGFPDALSAAPVAALNGWPILLTNVGSLPGPTSKAITDSGATASLVVGGKSVVSDAVENALPNATRADGRNRYETCAIVADFAVAHGCSYSQLGLATGANYPDALAAGPYLAQGGGLLMLTDPNGVSSYILQRLSSHKGGGAKFDAIGASSVVPDAVFAQAQTALQ